MDSKIQENKEDRYKLKKLTTVCKMRQIQYSCSSSHVYIKYSYSRHDFIMSIKMRCHKANF